MLTIAGGIILAVVVLASWERIREALPGAAGLVLGLLAFFAATFALLGWLNRSPDSAPYILFIYVGLLVAGFRVVLRTVRAP